MDVNTVIIGGTVMREPKFAHTQSGKAYCSFTLKNKGWGKGYNFLNVVAWGDRASEAAQLQDGDPVIVTGEVQTSSYEKNGEKRISTKISALKLHKNIAGSETGDFDGHSGNDVLCVQDDNVPF